jgi:uroporphyrinogen-III decarboxylase
VERDRIPHPAYTTTRCRCITPRGTLSMVLQDDGRTVWVAERLVKHKHDVDLIAEYAPVPQCDAAPVHAAASVLGSRGIVRGAVPGFALYGQPGCWQDAAVLFGVEPLIMATYDDPGWVLAFLSILRDRKLAFLNSTTGAPFDLLELGGGDASSTVISPAIFRRFVAPFDALLIAAAHAAGQRVVYHTCGGMMPLLEHIADMQPDAMETFTPADMGGDVRLAEAKTRVGDRVCMIGGFDQGHYFVGCPPDDTRHAVRACFDQAGAGGGFILAPSDHFFEADDRLLRAFADEAHACVYPPATSLR